MSRIKLWWSALSIQRRVKTLFIALDIFLFACLCLGNVKRNETASSASWALLQQGKWQGRVFVPLIDTLALLFGDADHCADSWLTENKEPRNG